MADLVGKVLGHRYRVVARLGRGGMAIVYKADQPGLGRYVAIKVLHSHLVDDEDFIGRFGREARAVGSLRHSNIVQALDFDHEGEMYFMAMEYIDGPTLKSELRARKADNKPFTHQEIARIFTALCSAIDYAHKRGMVHRDLKPANVMINGEGQIVLTDFGIARIMGATQYTQTGALSGTPAYMSPEQGQGQRGDKRSDIYSLGIMLYEMMTGTVPYDADTPFAVIMKHISEDLPLPTKIDPNIPENIEQVVLKAMGKEPDKRYQSAGEMAQALREAVGLAPGDTLQSFPLTALASGPQVEEIDHPTGPITEAEIMASSAAFGNNGITSIVSGVESTTMAAPASSPSMLPFLIGGSIIILLILAAIGGGFVIVTQSGRAQTATAVAMANYTAVARQVVVTAEAATAEAAAATAAILAPTETAQAAMTQQAQIAATEVAQATRDAELLGGALAAQAATATAQAAVDKTATAEALARIPTPTTPAATPTSTPSLTPSPTSPLPPTNTPTPIIPADDIPIPDEKSAISGKLAYSADNGSGKYDVFIVSMPDGTALGEIQGARQPNFRPDGVRLIVNAQGGGFGEDVWEADFKGNIIGPVSSSPSDSHPTYNPDGGRIAYGNPQLAIGNDGNYHSYIFVQCSITPPAQDVDKCQNVAQFGILVPAGQTGEIQGSNPVWAANDHIFFKGCNSWAGGGSCGIFTAASWGTKQFSNGETPRKIGPDGTSTTPTDTKGNLVAFHSIESGSWEAYVMDLSGTGIVNISNSPTSNDGLPTISPDGQWVAFATDRDGGWAIYVAPSSGGAATKLLNFPKSNPWGEGDRSWQTERISWGP